jgi:katanin p60 ATPase-containing subunit A1
MRPLRRLMERLNDDLEPAGFGTDEEVTVGEITGDDIVGALSATRPTQTEAHAKRYVEWTNSFGAVL